MANEKPKPEPREYTVDGPRGRRAVTVTSARRAVIAWAKEEGLTTEDPPVTVTVTRGAWSKRFEVWARDEPTYTVEAA